MTHKPGVIPDDGWVAVVKRDCPTCVLVAPILTELQRAGLPLTIYSQDDASFPDDDALTVIDDLSLEASYRLGIRTVPSLLHIAAGKVESTLEGWERDAWRRATGVENLGEELPPQRPGCGSLSQQPGIAERLEATYGTLLQARHIELAELEDEIEALFERGWSDGLPVVPPTPERVLRMLSGTTRHASDVIAEIPPNLAPCTVEKVAINAVMAGCKPEYLPVVLAAVEAACRSEFGLHGLIATTLSHAPIIIVNGPIVDRIGLNYGVDALGQSCRANATIGRALQLVIKNVGGGRPGEIDRACLGQPGKLGFCIAENEADSPWTSLATERGFAADASTVTLFGGEGPRVVVDQLSRTAESLVTSLAACMKTICHPKLPMAFDALLVISPEHGRVFRQADWDKSRLRQELLARLMLPGSDLVRGAHDMAEGIPETLASQTLPKIRPEGILMIHAGGPAGLFSAIIGGWVNGQMGTDPVSVEIVT